MKSEIKIFLITCLLALYAEIAFPQIEPSIELNPEETQLFNLATQHFYEYDFENAHRSFSQLLSLYSREPVFKYYFGACIIELKLDISKGIDYLDVAAANGIVKANFYIARGYHHLYDFENAIKHYEKYKSHARTRELRHLDIDRFIRKAKNGQQLVKYAYELQVVYNRTIRKQNFHYSYDFSNFGGRLIVKPERFRTRHDRNIEEPDLMYMSDIHDLIFMSSYGGRRGGSLNIYKIQKKGDDWGEPELLPAPINDEYDQAYPFIAADGVSLYFSSKGHNSMGGYDIFKSEYDSTTNSWSEPVNLDFPINTPYDDVMFVKDVFGETAFFASNRDVRDDRITIYRILLETEPQQRLLSGLNEIHKTAKLEVSLDAISELKTRQSDREQQIKDRQDGDEQAHSELELIPEGEQITLEQTEDFIDSIRKVSMEHKAIAVQAFEGCEMAISKVKELRRKKESVTDKEKESEIDEKIIEYARKAVVFHEITRLANNQYLRINSQLDYHQNELSSIVNQYKRGTNVKSQIVNLRNLLNQINLENPERSYINDKIVEVDFYQSEITSIENELQVLTKSFKDNKKKISKNKQMIFNNPESGETEKLLSEIKALEITQQSISKRIKDLKINKEVSKRELNIAQNELDIANTIDTPKEKEYVLDYEISPKDGEISLLRVYLNQQNLESVSQVQAEILAENIFEPEFDLIYNELNILQIEKQAEKDHKVSQMIYETSEIVDRYDRFINEETKNILNNIQKKDSLRLKIKDLENRFDETTQSSEKEKLLTEINKASEEINIIENKLNEIFYEDVVQIETLPSKNEIANLKKRVESQPDLYETIQQAEDLSNQIETINEKIQDLSLNKDENRTELRYLDALKGDLAQNLLNTVTNVETTIDIFDKFDSGDIVRTINANIEELHSDHNLNIDKSEDLYMELFENYSKISELQELIITTTNDRRRNRAKNNIKDLWLETQNIHLNYLDISLESSAQKLKVYDSYFDEYKEFIPPEARLLLDKTDRHFAQSEEYISLAESEKNIANKINFLIKAETEKDIAIKYYEYIFEYATEQPPYASVPEAVGSDRIMALSNISTSVLESLKIDEDLHDEDIAIAGGVTDFSEMSLPEPDFENINRILSESILIENNIQDLVEKYENAQVTEKSDIIISIESENERLKEKIFELNKLVVKKQKKQILYAKDSLNIEFHEFNEKLDEYVSNTEKAIQENDYMLLSEVLIMGESLMNLTRDYFPENIIIPEVKPEKFDLMQRNIADNQSKIIGFKNEIAKAKDTEDLVLVEEKTEIAQKLDDFEDLPEIVYREVFSDYEKTQGQIDSIQLEVAHATSNRQRRAIREELEQLYDEQILNIKTISEINQAYYEELSNIAKSNISIVEAEKYNEFLEIREEATSLRNTIINFSHFHSPERLIELNMQALNLENQALELFSEIVESDVYAHHTEKIDVIKQDEDDLYIEDKDEIKDEKIDLLADEFNEYEHVEKLEFDEEEIKLAVDSDVSENQESEVVYREEVSVEDDEEIDSQDSYYDTQEIEFSSPDFSFYSYSEPIKELEEVEEGLSYRIQIGAFNRPVPNEVFKGVSPILIENVSGSNLLRYVVGLFGTFEAARTAQPTVRALGYDDCFIVAYYNGERIPIYQARQMETDPSVEERLAQTESGIDIEQQVEEGVVQKDDLITQTGLNISEMEDLFFTVQVGVYRERLTASRLFGLSPLMYENLDNNLVRHFYGRYSNYEDAFEQQNRIRQVGISDAFVTAYRQGRKIPVSQARSNVSEDVSDIDVSELSSRTDEQTEISDTETISDAESETITFEENKPEYYVQVGAYRSSVSPQIRRIFNGVAGEYELFETEQQTGILVYRVGKFQTYDEALIIQNIARGSGISDAFIVALLNNQRISISEARSKE